MKTTLTVEREFHVGRRGHGAAKVIRAGNEPAPPHPTGRVPRVTRLLALAHRFEQLVRDGVVEDYAELAEIGHVTRARVTQIMALLQLVPDIQEAILNLPPVLEGDDPISERELRPIAAELDWRMQRRMWKIINRDKLARR